MNALERAAHERQTQSFIDRDSDKIVLYRAAKSDDGQGGTIEGEPEPLATQTVRVVGQRNGPPVVIADGRQIKLDKSLIGMPTFDVEIGDTFSYQNRSFEVVWIQRDPVWRIEAGAVEVMS